MSSVTEVMLCVGYRDKSRLRQINGFLKLDGDNEFAPVNEQTFPLTRTAGGKGFTADVFVAGINYLELDSLLELLRKIEFEQPECVQLIFQGEHDDRFSLVNVFDEQDYVHDNPT